MSAKLSTRMEKVISLVMMKRYILKYAKKLSFTCNCRYLKSTCSSVALDCVMHSCMSVASLR